MAAQKTPTNSGILVPWRKTLSAAITSTVSGGSGTLTFQDPSHSYRVEQISMFVVGATGGQAVVEIDGAFICGTNSAALDSADGAPSIDLRANSILTIAVAGVQGLATAGVLNVTLIGVAVYNS